MRRVILLTCFLLALPITASAQLIYEPPVVRTSYYAPTRSEHRVLCSEYELLRSFHVLLRADDKLLRSSRADLQLLCADSDLSTHGVLHADD